jgi:hypothetical protein
MSAKRLFELAVRPITDMDSVMLCRKLSRAVARSLSSKISSSAQVTVSPDETLDHSGLISNGRKTDNRGCAHA